MGRLIATVAIALAAAAAAAGEEKCTAMTAGEAQVVDKTNEARAKNGSVALVVDCRLMASARRHANRMAREMRMYHSGKVAENVAVGAATAEDAVVVWLNSPGHRANILNRGYRRIGVAGFVGPNGKAYWVQQFAP